MEIYPDFRDLIGAFAAADVRYLLVGGYAVGFHGRPRFTKDLDLWIEDSEENLLRLAEALVSFGAPGNLADELRRAEPLDVVWMGRPPTRIDLVKAIPGVTFADVYPRRTTFAWHDVFVAVIGRNDLIAAKRASGRDQDLLDVKVLEGAERRP
ncbi:MAG TPA: hypothetical protein VGP07_11635 [Polyangia bacterium]|jgi:hypothetical protein